MQYRLLISIEVVEFPERLPSKTRQALRNAKVFVRHLTDFLSGEVILDGEKVRAFQGGHETSPA